MARNDPAPPAVLANPQISLAGDIDKVSVETFLSQLADAEKAGGDIAMELTTLGGDPDLARRILLEIELTRARLPGRFCFLGKTVVYSAGITIMSAFPCRDRWLTGDTMLMIHGRKLEQTVTLSGPIRASIPMIDALRAQMDTALMLEEDGFRRLADGCTIGFDTILEKALHNWYVSADEAVALGLVAGLWQPGAAVDLKQ